MKNIYIFSLISLISFNLNAQEISDVFRLSQDHLTGTARFSAMGGAFGALGGDLSSINSNPAGSVVFSNNQAAATLSSFNISNKSKYFGTNTNENNNSIDLNQAGFVFVFENSSKNNDWRKLSIAVNYENANDFNNTLYSAGTNPTRSIDNYFLYYANANSFWPGIRLEDLQNIPFENLSYADQQASLGYESYIINPIPLASDPNNSNHPNITSYSSGVAPGGKYKQTNYVDSSGYNGKVTFNVASQYKDKFMFGININTHFLDYRRISRFTESNNNNQSTTTDLVNHIEFNNDLYSYGSGFSLQIGTIYKPSKNVRFGFSYLSPTWYRLTDELRQSIRTISGNATSNLPADAFNPDITMVYPIYKIKNPAKLTSSFAYIFGKKGLISFDYTLKNYSNATLKPKSDAIFQSINNTITNIARENASEYRVGGEYKIEQFSIRAGYRFEQSPYKNSAIIGNLNGYSGGFGYNFGGYKLDFAYTSTKREYHHQFFSQGLTDGATINARNFNFLFTFSLEL